MRPLPQPSLLVITDRKQAKLPLKTVVSRIFAGGCRWLLLREKDLSKTKRLELAGDLAALARHNDAKLLISGDVEAARLADGLQLPCNGDLAAARAVLGAQALIGISTHDRQEVAAAAEAGADYVTLSPIFLTASKPGYGPALGLETLRAIAKDLPVPILALGGITAANAADCCSAGAAGIAAMGSVMGAEAPDDTVARLLTALRDGKAGGSPIGRKRKGL